MDSQADVKDQCHHAKDDAEACKWYEEEIDDDLKWSFALNSVLHKGTSKYQEIALIDTKRFGKALVIDGKMQSAEIDEFIYHECLIHPPLLCHPKSVLPLFGHARGIFHILIEVVDFCRKYLTVNQNAFRDSKLCLIINDAKAELEKREEQFDIIVGDLSDPMEGGPCYQLYTKSFYEKILKPKLRHQGIFITQAGPAGVLTHKEVFSSIYNTLKHVFKYVVVYTAHVPSFADMWGWVMASDEPLVVDSRQIDERIGERINGELLYLNGESLVSSTTMNKSVYTSLLNETHIYTEENARFLYGHGMGC
ncbi:hypothetical protein ZIOFF_026487 [Zingiber officinale]|uniref:thermospermine synthase n=1 Tax=Zingiber officinale TaxID=94328 RepID=A0A8J5GXI6_ZINOF|nr:hypothetical protein ZIOFF_026487 [Zingiber officinale]